MLNEKPDPHLLDYDWRFTLNTVTSVAGRLPGGDCLALGVPSVAEHLQNIGTIVVGVDRNPLSLPLNGILLDLDVAPPLTRMFECAVVDPPWYPAQFRRWTAWAAYHLPPGGSMLVSMWPIDTRPSAPKERKELLHWLRTWSEVVVYKDVLRYRVPEFEAVVRRLKDVPSPRTPWRSGDLVEITLRIRPNIPAPIHKETFWTRFIWDQYQLALRIRPHNYGPLAIKRHPNAEGWIWPSVSARAEGRAQIDLWSSSNEVAVVSDNLSLNDQLLAFSAQSGRDFGLLDSKVADLLRNWNTPQPPFKKVTTWIHHD